MRIGLLRSLGSVLASVTMALPIAWLPAPAGAAPGDDATTIRAYVANSGSNSVSVIDMSTETVAETIALSGDYSQPVDVALSADGTLGYVVTADGSLAVLDTTPNILLDTVAVPGRPSAVATAPSGDRVYITDRDGDALTVLDLADPTNPTTIPVGDEPADVAVSASGGAVYVANFGSDTVSVLDAATATVVATVTVGNEPAGVTVSPDGGQVYVATAADKVDVIDADSNTVIARHDSGAAVHHIAVAPDGVTLYAATTGIRAIRATDGVTDYTLAAASGPGGAEVTPDGAAVLVSAQATDRVTVYDTSLGAAGTARHIAVGNQPAGIAVAVIPAATYPGNLAAAPAPGTGEIGLNWDAPPNDPASYRVYAGTASTGPFAEVTAGSCTSVAGTDTSCTVSGLTPGTEYYFVLVAQVGGFDSAESDRASALAIEPPAAPATPSAAATASRTITVTWTAATSTDEAPVEEHQLEMSDDGGDTYNPVPAGTCVSMAASPCTVTGLGSGSTYRFRVVAVNPAGAGVSAGSTGVTAVAAPSAPSNVGVEIAGVAEVEVSWTPPGGIVDSYRVSVATAGTSGPYTKVTSGACATPAASPCLLTGLTPGTQFWVKISSVRGGVEGALSGVSNGIWALGLPGRPGTPAAVIAGDKALELSWSAASVPAPSDGTPVDGYRVEVAAGAGGYTTVSAGGCAQPATSPCTLSGLAAGTSYKFQVTALNTVGPGITSPESSALIAATVPSAPTLLTATRGNGSVSLSFTAPASTGWSDLTRYDVSTDGGSTWAPLTVVDGTGAARTATVPGLANGTTYAVKVRAVNAVGEGAVGDAGQVTPATVPAAPTNLTVTPGDAGGTLSFVPGGNGGDSVIRYEVSTDDGANWARVSTEPGTGGALTVTLTGLENATLYPVRVRAVNGVGEGAESEGQALTPVAVPAPTPTATATPSPTPTATASATVTPTATATAAPAPSVSDTPAPTAAPAPSVTAAPTPTAVPTPTVTVAPIPTVAPTPTATATPAPTGSAGPAPTAVPTPAPTAVLPGAPSAVSAVAGTSSITVRWAAPTENAGLVARYTAFADPGPASCTTASARETTCTLGAVAGTSYTVTVIAHTAAGVDSAQSGPSAPVTATLPAVPVIAPDTDATMTTDRGPISAAAPGQQIVLIGTGFAPHSTVTIAIYSEPMLLATAVTDGRGDFTHGVTVPADLPVGEHTFVATGVDADGDPYAMKLPVAVAPTARAGALAVTGAGTAPLVATGLLVIVVGAVARRTGAASGRPGSPLHRPFNRSR